MDFEEKKEILFLETYRILKTGLQVLSTPYIKGTTSESYSGVRRVYGAVCIC